MLTVHTSQPQTLTDIQTALVDAVGFFHQKGWTPATSSNFSCRTPEAPEVIAMSISGLDKGNLTPQDFIPVDLSGNVLPDVIGKPSAETLLHTLVYRQFPSTHAIAHIHSENATVFSLLYEKQGFATLKGFELLKAFEGITTHDTELMIPVFPNSQNMPALAKTIEGYFQTHTHPCYGFLLAGHGLYAWGNTVAQARRHTEAFEFLFGCQLKLRSYGDSDYSR